LEPGADGQGVVSHSKSARARQFRFVRTDIHDLRLESGQLRTVAPVDPAVFEVEYTVHRKFGGNEYPHIGKAIQNGQYHIGNHRGFINGWIGPQKIYGKYVKVEP
jgi:hypothetical protein